MILTRVEIDNFRNFSHQEFEPGSGFNLVVGRNAQGKTNLLEAIYCLGIGRSYRTGREAEVISFDSSWARVAGSFSSGQVNFNLEMVWEKEPTAAVKKTARYNGNTVFKLSDFIEKAPIALFVPEDLDLVRGSPGQRRRYLDLICSKLYPAYLDQLRTYRNILSQRNRWLKLKPQTRNPAVGEVLTDKLIQSGTFIIHRRLQVLDSLKNEFAEVYRQIFNQEPPTLSYRSSVKNIQKRTSGEIAEAYKKAMKELSPAEKQHRFTLAGPHRDDFDLKVDKKSLRKFASLGEIRSAAAVLKIAEVEVISSYIRKQPLFLMDDCLNEFDQEKTRLFLNFIRDNSQVIYTRTMIDDYFKNVGNLSIFRIREGRVESCAQSG